jgi:hypothetical protein
MMAADLVLAAGPGAVELAGDPAAFVVAACERAGALLQQALKAGEIEQIAEVRSQAEAVRVYTRQKQLGRDAELAAAEIVRRAERGIGVAIRRAQQPGQIAKRGDRGSRGAPGMHGGNPGDTRGDHLGSAASFFKHPSERVGAYAMADGATDGEFEAALTAARAEGNLSRANVVRKIRQRGRPTAGCGVPIPASAGECATSGGDHHELIAAHAARGMSSHQIAARLGISSQRVRKIAREHDIEIRADAVTGRARRPDSTRIVRETAHALEGLAMGVQLADPAGLDPAQTAEWAASLARSIRVLARFARQLKEVSNGDQ